VIGYELTFATMHIYGLDLLLCRQYKSLGARKVSLASHERVRVEMTPRPPHNDSKFELWSRAEQMLQC
jgi:hypothetical protein